jgi:hypothetical protein
MAIAFVKEIGTFGDVNPASQAVVVVPSGGVVQGNLIVGVVVDRVNAGASLLGSVFDSKGNIYSISSGIINDHDPGLHASQIIYAVAQTALSPGDTITITWPPPNSHCGAKILEYTGGVHLLDGNARAMDNAFPASAAGDSGLIATANADDLLIGVAIMENAAGTPVVTEPAGGWTARGADKLVATDTLIHIADRIVAAPGSYQYNPTFSVANYWAAHILALKGGGFFTTLTAAEQRARTKVWDKTWINAHYERKQTGMIAVRVQRKMSPTNRDYGAWTEITDDSIT